MQESWRWLREGAIAADSESRVRWQSLDDLNAALATDEGRKAAQTLIEDEARFIDFAQSRCFLTEEHTIFEGL